MLSPKSVPGMCTAAQCPAAVLCHRADQPFSQLPPVLQEWVAADDPGLDVDEALDAAGCQDLKCPITCVYALCSCAVLLLHYTELRARLQVQTLQVAGRAAGQGKCEQSHTRSAARQRAHACAAQLYERDAVLRWLHLRHTVPHSPADRASPGDLTRCPRMERLLAELAAEFHLQQQVAQ